MSSNKVNWKTSCRVLEPNVPINKRDGALYGKYVNLAIDLYKCGENIYYYFNDNNIKKEVVLNPTDDGKLIDFDVIGRKFYVKLY